jgi:hypothetical protein
MRALLGGVTGALLVAVAVAVPPPAAAAAGAGAGDGKVSTAAARWLSDASVLRPAGWLDPPAQGDDWEQDDWDWVARATEERPDDGRKSLLKAVAASALLPGLGERYVGRGRRATVFHVAEGAIWAAFGSYRIQGDLRKDRYVEWAQVQAGANPDGDSAYLEHIGLWISLEEWHDIVRRDARLRFPDDPAAQAEYFEENLRYGEGEAWAWPDDETRLRYRQLRSGSERSYRNARLALGLAIVNRLASMVDALALARQHNRNVEQEEARLRLRIEPMASAGGLVLGPVLSARY